MRNNDFGSAQGTTQIISVRWYILSCMYVFHSDTHSVVQIVVVLVTVESVPSFFTAVTVSWFFFLLFVVSSFLAPLQPGRVKNCRRNSFLPLPGHGGLFITCIWLVLIARCTCVQNHGVPGLTRYFNILKIFPLTYFVFFLRSYVVEVGSSAVASFLFKKLVLITVATESPFIA